MLRLTAYKVFKKGLGWDAENCAYLGTNPCYAPASEVEAPI